MSWLLPDPPTSGQIEDVRSYLSMLRGLSPRTDDVVEAIDEGEEMLTRMEREQPVEDRVA